MLPPKPFHDGPESAAAAGFEQYADFGMTSSGARYEPAGRPVTYSETARRSASVSDAPCRRIVNELSAVSTCSGVSVFSASRPGILGLQPWWQPAQCWRYTVSPSGA